MASVVTTTLCHSTAINNYIIPPYFLNFFGFTGEL